MTGRTICCRMLTLASPTTLARRSNLLPSGQAIWSWTGKSPIEPALSSAACGSPTHQPQRCLRRISTRAVALQARRHVQTFPSTRQLSLLPHAQTRSLATVTDTSKSSGLSPFISDMSVHRSKYAAVVVGAGPAGICSVGHMLERRVGPVLWVDDEFNGGRINRAYREVPSNTKTKLFVDFAEKLKPFRSILEAAPRPNAMDTLRKLDQDKGTTLGNAGDMLNLLTRGLMHTPGVEVRKGRVESASLDSNKNWTVSLSMTGHDSPLLDRSTVISERLILCQGSSPTSHPLPVQVPGLIPLELDTALSISAITAHLRPDEAKTIAVIGASHSAVLVLLNLAKLAQSTHPHLRVRWFTRHALRYAEFMDGWVLRDNTGLKGEAADWARENLEPGKLEHSPVARFIEPVSYEVQRELETYQQYLPGCDYIVQAVGFTRDPIPDLKREGSSVGVQYDHHTGGFSDEGTGAKVPGLYGAGIAWPERVTDPHGNVEYAVGFFKFMKYLQRVSCDWN